MQVASYTNFFADALIAEAERDSRIIGIHAAMGGGTGMNRFQKRFNSRTFDVGIAEQHAVTFAAGLACEGMAPFVAIYSTFLQRGYDQIVHDVCLQKLPGMLLSVRLYVCLSALMCLPSCCANTCIARFQIQHSDHTEKVFIHVAQISLQVKTSHMIAALTDQFWRIQSWMLNRSTMECHCASHLQTIIARFYLLLCIIQATHTG